MRRYLFPIAIALLVAVELILALHGPMAFVQKPSTIITRPYYYGLDADEVDQVFDHVQRSFARTKLFRVISHELIEDYYLEKQDDPDFTLQRQLNYQEYAELARELELERIVVPSIYPGGDRISVRVSIRLPESGQTQHSISVGFGYRW